MSAQQANLDTVANNLANSATAGFRRRRLQFEDMIYQNMITPGSPQSQQTTSAGLQIGLGTRSAATEMIMTQGDFNQTGNNLDLAIQGAGFFQVSKPDGTIAFTRSGNFHRNNQGTMVTADGDTVLPAITIPSNATDISISSYGVVSAKIPGQSAPAQLGTIQLATFANPGGLNSIGGNLFGKSHHRQSRRKHRHGNAAARLSRELQRRCRRRVRSDDPGAARLREQLEGRSRSRRHVLTDQQHDSLGTSCAHTSTRCCPGLS
jgi:flagellar basal body rod protein FlgG